MKVMCIDEKGQKNANMPKIPFGKIVEVSQCSYIEYCYTVAGYEADADGIPNCYDKKHFAPLSQIDETELVEQRLITA